MTEATAPSAKACAVAAIADSACIALVATMPSSHGGSAAASLVACRPRVHVARARQPQAVRADRVDVRLREVEGPHLDVVERGEIGREQRPDRAAADDADPHGAVPSGADRRRAAGDAAPRAARTPARP